MCDPNELRLPSECAGCISWKARWVLLFRKNAVKFPSDIRMNFEKNFYCVNPYTKIAFLPSRRRAFARALRDSATRSPIPCPLVPFSVAAPATRHRRRPLPSALVQGALLDEPHRWLLPPWTRLATRGGSPHGQFAVRRLASDGLHGHPPVGRCPQSATPIVTLRMPRYFARGVPARF